MSSNRYDYEALYFDIYRKVLKLNETLGEQAFDKSQLQEITTSIFIAYSQRGVVRPFPANGFLDSLNTMLTNIKNRSMQEQIYKQVKQIINERNTHKEET